MKKLLFVLMLVVPFALFAQQKADPPVPASGNVSLPLDEYNRLLELASASRKKPDTPPVPYSLKRADVKLRVADEAVLGTIQFEGEVLRSGATRVPLTSGLTILDAHQEARNLPLQQDGGVHSAILPGPGNFSVSLNAGLPLSIEAGRASFSFPAPAAGSVRLTLVVPGDHANVRINPGLITNRTSENGQTTIEATLQPGQYAGVWWTTREVAAPTVPKEVRFLSEVKSLVSVSEADLRIAALADTTVVQGEPSQFEIPIPEGYEVTGTAGASIESSEIQSGILTIKVATPALRSHQFLISMEKPITEAKSEAPFLGFRNSQRETGEVLVEGSGTIELTSIEGGGLKRMDLKEVNPYLRSLARFPLQAAFRYHRQSTEAPKLALAWTRFPDSSVLSAVVERAIVTTLVTTEGKSLTEIRLTLKNQAQPFLKVDLPTGATILSADVAGEKVKPVEAPDGNRVPLLRPGFRPTDSYEVSFVFMHSGSPFAKKGGSDISLPKMDVPISLLQWEIFLPEQYKVKDFGGDAIAASLLPSFQGNGVMVQTSSFQGGVSAAGGPMGGLGPGSGGGTGGGAYVTHRIENIESLAAGQLGGIVVDATGAVVPGARITIVNSSTGFSQATATDSEGHWVASGVPSGNVQVTADANGYKSYRRAFNYDAGRPAHLSATLEVAAALETVEVTASATTNDRDYQRAEREAKKQAAQQQTAASANVYNLQKRVSGVLPVRVDVPRAGNSYRFVRPLVLDEETKVSFTYKTK